MTPSEMPAGACADEVPAARATASPTTRTRASFMVCAPLRGLYPKVFVQLVHAGGERGVGDHVDHSSVLDDVVAVGHGGREMKVLLDEKDGEPLLLETRDRAADLLHDHGGEALGRLVQEQQ